MGSRSLNKVQLIGNLTRDPELRYTPNGTAVCTIGLATNRSWTTESSEKKEEAEFHRLIAWNKLAELCSQLLFKGRKIYVEGRLQTRQWNAQDGTPRQVTEVIISDMIILDNKRAEEKGAEVTAAHPETATTPSPQEDSPAPAEEKKTVVAKKKTAKKEKETEETTAAEISEDIPF